MGDVEASRRASLDGPSPHAEAPNGNGASAAPGAPRDVRASTSLLDTPPPIFLEMRDLRYTPLVQTGASFSYAPPQMLLGRLRGVRLTPARRAAPGRTRSRKAVLHGVSSSAAPGQLCALMGPSGSGKTSLLSVVAGFVDASAVEGTGTCSARTCVARGRPAPRAPHSARPRTHTPDRAARERIHAHLVAGPLCAREPAGGCRACAAGTRAAEVSDPFCFCAQCW